MADNTSFVIPQDLDHEKIEKFLELMNPHPHIPAPAWTLDDYQKGNIAIFKDAEGNNFIPGSYFRTHIDVQLDRGDKPNILLGENNIFDPRIQKLNQFAVTFKEVSDKNKYPTLESAQAYIKTTHNFVITLDQAKVLQGDNQVKKEEFFAKTFHKQIHEVFGDYNGEISRLLSEDSKQNYQSAEALLHSPKGKFKLEDMTKFYQQKREIYEQELKQQKLNADGAEEFKTIGKDPGQFNPVCRHYAAIMSTMLDNAGIANYVFTCDQGGHATVASMVTGNIFETTASAPEKNYKYSLNLKNPDDLRELKQVFYYTDRQGHPYVISTNKGSDINVDQLEERALRSALITKKEKELGGAEKFGEKLAIAHEEGHKPQVLPTLDQIKKLPKNQQPKLDPEVSQMLDRLRDIQHNSHYFDQPKPTYQGSGKRHGDSLQTGY